MFPEIFYGKSSRRMGWWGHYFRPFGLCTPGVRAVSVYSALSQVRSLWVLDTAKVVPCHDIDGHGVKFRRAFSVEARMWVNDAIKKKINV